MAIVRLSYIALSAATLILCTVTPRSGLAQERYFEGKTISLIVGYSAGGGYDQYSRTLARHLGRHIAGSPTVLVQNMPGAASFTAVRYLDASAPKDGTAITMFDPGLITESLASPELFKIKFSDFHWIGAMLRDVRICYAWAATGVKNWNDMMNRKEFFIGNTAKGSNAYIDGAILRKIFNAPVRQIPGYPGSNEQRLALERGELEGNCASWSAMPQDWIANSKINALARFSPKRPADMPASVPYIGDLASTQEQKDLIAVLNASAELGRPLIVSGQVPADRMKLLRSAFEETLKDPLFLSDAKKQALPLDPVSGEEAEQIVSSIYKASPELAQRVKQVIE
jgi:tripartite-type tricarboxylate transporter receptor subunit TctC